MFFTMNIIMDVLSDFNIDADLISGSDHFHNILISETAEKNYATISSKKNYVEIVHNKDTIKVYNAGIHDVVNIIMLRMREYELWEKELFRKIFNNCTLQDMINYIYKIYRLPIFIADETDRILARTPHPAGSVNSEWDNIVNLGHMSFASTSRFRKFRDANNDAFYKNNKPCPVLLSPPGIESRGIQYKIHSPTDNSIIGLFVIIEENEPISLGQLNFCEVICDALSDWVKMHKNNLPFRTGEDLFIELMEAPYKIDNKDVIERFIPHCPKGYVMAVVQTNNAHEASEIRRIIRDSGKDIPAFIYYKDVIIIFPLSNPEKLLQDLLNRILYYNDVRIGTSYHFNDLMNLPTHYRQAVLAISYGKEKISKINPEIAMRFFSFEASGKAFGTSIICPALSVLQNYDRKHGSDYYRTLYEYLRCERSLVETAKKLGSHRNTVIYRIEKIEQLLEEDLNDPDIREYILLSYRIIHDYM